MPLGLFALAVGGFGIGLTEFVIVGLLPEIAIDFQVNESGVAILIWGYAVSVAVGAILLTAAVTRLPRKTVLVGLMVLFIVGNFVSAISGTFELMLTGRILAGLMHGAFFGIGSVVASGMVRPEKSGTAIAVMLSGLSIANVLGVPFGTFVGQNLGWRSTFWLIAIIGLVALIGIVIAVPQPRTATEANLRKQLSVFRRPQVWYSAVITILGWGGMFCAFTYVAFTLTSVTGFSTTAVPLLLVAFGIGSVIGNLIGGKAGDKNLNKTLIVALSSLTVVLGVFALTVGSKVMSVICLVLMAGFGFAISPTSQMRILSFASDAPTMASGANIAAFNVGNALAAGIGGLAITAGLGFASPIWIGAGLSGTGLLILLLASRLALRDTVRP
ncbi:MFS transporter [Rathayibacter soli]|uniref:MFS transporter n=1 Tax=Rathayibacter soli TaxID=3144168 RepID=UPI0027E3CE1C|nr:MFS transporter [Glaciibacter superstes]